MRRFRFSFVILALLVGCSHNNKLKPLGDDRIAQPIYYLDNSLPFQPKRIWRLIVSWDHYPLNKDQALINKEFQLVVHNSEERTNLERSIKLYGGDERYLLWLEGELSPLAVGEKRDQARIARLSDALVVTLTFKASQKVEKTGMLGVGPVSFPDPIFRSVHEGCQELNWDVIRAGDSVGVEIALESRNLDPSATKWLKEEADLPNFFWRSWSVGQGQRIAYRTAVFFKNNVSRCPLPSEIAKAFSRMDRSQEMGISW